MPDNLAASLVFLEFFCFASVVLSLLMLPLSLTLRYVRSEMDRPLLYLLIGVVALLGIVLAHVASPRLYPPPSWC